MNRFLPVLCEFSVCFWFLVPTLNLIIFTFHNGGNDRRPSLRGACVRRLCTQRRSPAGGSSKRHGSDRLIGKVPSGRSLLCRHQVILLVERTNSSHTTRRSHGRRVFTMEPCPRSQPYSHHPGESWGDRSPTVMRHEDPASLRYFGNPPVTSLAPRHRGNFLDQDTHAETAAVQRFDTAPIGSTRSASAVPLDVRNFVPAISPYTRRVVVGTPHSPRYAAPQRYHFTDNRNALVEAMKPHCSQYLPMRAPRDWRFRKGV